MDRGLSYRKGNNMGDSFFSMINLAIGAYLLYCAITGSGYYYRNENVKKGMEALYKKRLRIMGFILGPILLAQAAVEYLFPGNQTAVVANYVLYGLSLVAMIFLFVFTFKMTDRTKARTQAGKGSAGAPRSAFEFDEEEDKNDKGH